jgi:hypothetical protein
MARASSASAAGLIDGNQLVLVGRFDDREPRSAPAQTSCSPTRIVVRRTTSGIRDKYGYTERAGETARHDEDVFRPTRSRNRRLDAHRRRQHYGQVGATDYATTADRPALAFDGDPVRRGAPVMWWGSARSDPTSPCARPRHACCGSGHRSIAEVRLHFDGGDTLDVQPAPVAHPGRSARDVPERTVSSFAVEIQLDIPTSTRLRSWVRGRPGDVRQETIRLPVD